MFRIRIVKAKAIEQTTDKFFHPMRNILDVAFRIAIGKKSFWSVYSYSNKLASNINNYAMRMDAIGPIKRHGTSAWKFPMTCLGYDKRLHNDNCYLSDFNIKCPNVRTGYNDHYLFTSEVEAVAYINYRNNTGKKLTPTGNTPKSIQQRRLRYY